MERNTLLKTHSIQGENVRSMKDNNKLMKKDSWRNITSSFGETSAIVNGELFTWPPRSYSCSFCKREFRSAQALGGHMNVHRRDRARLRQYSPPKNGQFSLFNLNLDPNPSPSPNPNFSSSISSPYSSSSTSSILFQQPFASNASPLASPPMSFLSKPPPSNENKTKTTENFFKTREFDCFLQRKESDVVKRGLNLEMGMLTDSNNDLDLELRLGYS